MYSLEIIAHRELQLQQLDSIIAIKSVAWPYSYIEHQNWIENHLKPEDLHVLFKRGNEVLAYLNLVDIEVVLNDKLVKCWGVGNVCSKERGKGYGVELMKKVNEFILHSHRVGVLFCKDPLLKFYKTLSWLQIPECGVSLKAESKVNTLIFGVDLGMSTHCLSYNGKLF